jgi:hypothetical protein
MITQVGKSRRLDELSKVDIVGLADNLCGYIQHPEVKSLWPDGENAKRMCADYCDP